MNTTTLQTTQQIETKICHQCLKEKSLSEFYIRKRRNKYVHETICKECHKNNSKEYRKTHKDTYNETLRNWSHKNPDKIKKIKAKYRKTHRNEIREKGKEQAKRYRMANKNNPNFKAKKAAYDSKRRERMKNNDPTTDYNLIAEFYKKAKELNTAAGYIKYQVDHIIPLSRGGKHHQDNLQILLAEENLKKSNKLPQEK